MSPDAKRSRQVIREDLKTAVQTWTELNEAIKNVDTDYMADHGYSMTTMKEQRKLYADEIVSVVEKHPGMWDDAAAWGFNSELLPDIEDERRGIGTDPQDPDPKPNAGDGGTGAGDGGAAATGGGGGGGNSGNSGGGGGGRHGGGGGNDPDRLSGKLGHDYEFYRRGGKFYLVYDVELRNGKHFRGRWKVPGRLMDFYGLDKGTAKPMTDAMFKKTTGFGSIDQVKLRGRHPVHAFLEEMADKFGISPSLIRNRGVMEVLFEAKMEKWDASRILGALQQTPYYQNKTQQRVKWDTQTSDAEKKNQIQTTAQRLREHLQSEFGGVDPGKYVTDKQLEHWAEKVASGAIGWDEAGAMFKISKQARKVEGTNAWYRWQQETTAVGNKIEDRFVQVRDDMEAWLGPHGRPSNDVARQWAKDLAAGTKSDADWDKQLRQWSSAAYDYLGPGERWIDRATQFKRIAEQVSGRTIGFDDKLLRDLHAKDQNGNRISGQAMNFDDYEEKVRADDRAWYEGSPIAEEGLGLVNMLNQVFNGTAGGGLN